jgi:PIN domain nuclease of toxin-antitoxin system
MDFLLDTHAVLWFITGDSKLPKKTKQIIEDVRNNCFVSIATLWEIAIKNAVGKLSLHSDLDVIFKIIDDSGFELMPITSSHILRNASLPLHHHDPFDRIIIAQSLHENLAVITRDRLFKDYNAILTWEI